MAQNVVFLCINTVCYDYFKCYINDAQAVVHQSFDKCRTLSTWSVLSHASIFTVTLPNGHGFHSATLAFGELNRDDTFLSNPDDFWCVSVSANPYASLIFGFNDIFDDFYHVGSLTA